MQIIFFIIIDFFIKVCEDAVGRIWIATFGGGVNYMEQIEGKTRFINYRNKLKKFPIPLCYRTRDLVSDGNGRIWIATSNGLLACNGNVYLKRWGIMIL